MSATQLKKEKQKKEQRTRMINAEIEYFLVWKGYSKEQLAVKMGMSLASLYNKTKDIDKFTYPEFRKLCSILGLSDEKKLALIA